MAALTAGCGDTGCSAPSVDFAEATEAARGWVTSCASGDTLGARQYWTRTGGKFSDTQCDFLGRVAKSIPRGVEIVSIEEPISFLCMKQAYVTIKRNDDGRKGLILFFVESGVPSFSGGFGGQQKTAVLMGALLGGTCSMFDPSQPEAQEYFDSCFWYPSE